MGQERLQKKTTFVSDLSILSHAQHPCTVCGAVMASYRVGRPWQRGGHGTPGIKRVTEWLQLKMTSVIK